MHIKKTVVYLLKKFNQLKIKIMKALVKFIDTVSELLFGNQKGITQKHF